MSSHDPLTETQRWMATLLRHRRRLSRDPELAEQVRRHITGNDRLSPAEQLEIYREQFWLRHTSALLEDFPGLSEVLGQRDWERLVEGYLADHVPRSFTLRDLGRALPEYVAGQRDLPHLDLCTSMARLEWAYVEVFDAADAPPLDAAELAGIPPEAWEHARIQLSPALRLVAVTHPVADLRRALRRGDASESLPIPDAKQQYLVIYRHQRRLYDKRVSPAAFALLREFERGTPLVAACERAIEQEPDEAAELQGKLGDWFAIWGKLGWFSGVRLDKGTNQ
jgi:hypothetical protein